MGLHLLVLLFSTATTRGGVFLLFSTATTQGGVCSPLLVLLFSATMQGGVTPPLLVFLFSVAPTWGGVFPPCPPLFNGSFRQRRREEGSSCSFQRRQHKEECVHSSLSSSFQQQRKEGWPHPFSSSSFRRRQHEKGSFPLILLFSMATTRGGVGRTLLIMPSSTWTTRACNEEGYLVASLCFWCSEEDYPSSLRHFVSDVARRTTLPHCVIFCFWCNDEGDSLRVGSFSLISTLVASWRGEEGNTHLLGHFICFWRGEEGYPPRCVICFVSDVARRDSPRCIIFCFQCNEERITLLLGSFSLFSMRWGGIPFLVVLFPLFSTQQGRIFLLIVLL